MELVQQTLLDTSGAQHFTYYTLTTGFDINPDNGPEAKTVFDAVRRVIAYYATIEDDITF